MASIQRASCTQYKNYLSDHPYKTIREASESKMSGGSDEKGLPLRSLLELSCKQWHPVKQVGWVYVLRYTRACATPEPPAFFITSSSSSTSWVNQTNRYPFQMLSCILLFNFPRSHLSPLLFQYLQSCQRRQTVEEARRNRCNLIIV